MALVPWVIRFFIALPRWFVPGVSDITVLLDSLLLNLDRNNFSVLLPFYWVAVTTYFSQRSRLFLRADIIAADTLFIVLFSITPSAAMEVYRWPILMIGLFALVLFLQILSLVLSIPPELKLRKKEGIAAGVFLFLLIFLGGVLFIRPFQERAVERGGGLLEPKLFKFDFSQVLRLESEISMNDDLVLIVKKDQMDDHVFLRRYTLSGYSAKQGFYRHEATDEAAHPQRLPNRRTRVPSVQGFPAETDRFRLTEQEYYIVNFDASAFIGMNTPIEIIPFETWDASSFNSAYGVESLTSTALPYELIRAVRDEQGPDTLGMSPEEYSLYTDFGGDEEIAAFAREIIQSSSLRRQGRAGAAAPSYYEQIQMIYYRLKYREYCYSLKPGIAPDGDQLKYFLFTAKKGYCSYFAFAFTLMLRSLGIPCRVAAGFFVDPTTEAFNYYPVRTDMAHAWVEVWFPGYGWIEYDPTTQNLAEGEEFRFSQGTPPELFERLMKEILENRSRLREKEGEETEEGKADLAALSRRTLKIIAQWGPYLALGILLFLFQVNRSGYLWLYWLSSGERKKARRLWAHVKRRLALAGFGKSSVEGEAEWAKKHDEHFRGLYSIFLDYAAARFAPAFSSNDNLNMKEYYRSFNGEYRKIVPVWRRLLAWFLPPLALIIRPSIQAEAKGPKARGPGAKTAGTILVLIVFLLLRGELGQAQNGESADFSADGLYENALAAQKAENWDRAIEFFSMGANSFPSDFRFPWSLGNLYYNRRLYHLAWDEYRRAEKIISLESSEQVVALLFKLAYTAGYLNLNDVSADYLEKVLLLAPDNAEAIGTLGWMYFKLHRLPEGEKLLLDAMEQGTDADFAMTLGHIYSAMFRYREAKDSYLQAIAASDNAGNRVSKALSYYNLSILESRFYEFSLSYDCTNASLEAMNRASGRLARGELYLRRLEISRALAEYQDAYSMDSSPLSKLNLAQVFQTGGRLAEAVLYAEDCLKAKDESWMLNYGIDPVRYKRDIHEILKDAYGGLYRAESITGPDLFFDGAVKETAQSFFRKISYKFRAAVHTHLFRKYSLLAADAYMPRDETVYGETARHDMTRHDMTKYLAGGFHLEALTHYYDAFEAYPRRALAYLKAARNFEEPLIPASAPSYDYEEGRMQSNRKLLSETMGKVIGEFDPVWERDMIADAYAHLALKGNKAERQDAAERLFALNRGALLRNGIKLPATLKISGVTDHTGRILKKITSNAGVEALGGGSPRYTLTLSSSEQMIGGERMILCELYDGGRGITVFSSSLPLSISEGGTVTRSGKAAFARALRERIFDAF